MTSLPSSLSIRLGQHEDAGLRASESPTPEQWWAAANKPRRLNLVMAMALRNVDIFDSEGSHRASADVFGVLSADGAGVVLSGIPVEARARPSGHQSGVRVPVRPHAFAYGGAGGDGSLEGARTLAHAWRSWDERYGRAEGLFGTEPPEWLRRQLDELPKHSRVLVLGAGEGRNALWLAAAGHRVTAVDLSPRAVGRLEVSAKQRDHSITTYVGDAVRWLESSAGTDSWDVAVLNYFSAGSASLNRSVLRMLRARCSALIAEFARDVVPAEVILAGWGSVHLEYAEAKVPVIRVYG